MKNCLLSCEDIKIKYNDFEVLNNANVECHAGDCILFIGINGSGKTSLINVLAGHIQTTEGNVFFKEKNIKEISWKSKAIFCSYVPQFIEKLDDLYVKDYLEMCLASEGLEVEKLLLPLEVESLSFKKMGELSGGELKKLAFYAAIKNNPSVLFLDEPFQNLDPQTKMIFKNILIGFIKLGNAVIMVSHDFIWASQVANKVYGIKDGTLLLGKKDSTFFSKVMNHPFTQQKEMIVPETGGSDD